VYGNSYAGVGDDVTLNFDVADITPPVLLSSIPSNNATNATLSGNIVLNFDENIVAGTGNVTIRRSSDDSEFELIDISDPKIFISTTQLTISPAGTFVKGTGYYIEIDATALDDDAGNSFAGIR
jgi:methionine-rich copper-binding protein CopC